MSKPLSQMSLEELWQLFPIFLTEHRDIWTEWYAEEYDILKHALKKVKVHRMSHIGSTAIKDIWAKPIIDILVEVEEEEMKSAVVSILDSGYTMMSEDENRVSFNKGYTEKGFAEKVFHLHLRKVGDNDELYFRDYMNENPLEAKEYELLKLSICKIFKNNRDGYTEAKSSFICEKTKLAKEHYGSRYT